MAAAKPRSRDNLSRSICEDVEQSLRSITRASRALNQQEAKRYGLTGPQLAVLRKIPERKEISVGELAEGVRRSYATITGIIDRLEGRGLVAKRRSRSDRRKVLVQLTPPASRLLRDISPHHSCNFFHAFRSLPSWEQAMILSAVQRLEEILQSPGAKDRRERVPLC